MLWPEPATNAATQNIKGGKLVQQWKFDAQIRVVRSTLDGLRNRKSNMRSRSVFNIQCLFQCDICSIYKGLKQFPPGGDWPIKGYTYNYPCLTSDPGDSTRHVVLGWGWIEGAFIKVVCWYWKDHGCLSWSSAVLCLGKDLRVSIWWTIKELQLPFPQKRPRWPLEWNWLGCWEGRGDNSKVYCKIKMMVIDW